MVVFRIIKLFSWNNFCCNSSIAWFWQSILELFFRSFSKDFLFVAGEVNSRAILRSDVISLPVSLGGVVVLPENFQNVLKSNLFRLENDSDDLVVTRLTRTDFSVRRVRGETCGVTNLLTKSKWTFNINPPRFDPDFLGSSYLCVKYSYHKDGPFSLESLNFKRQQLLSSQR